MKLRVAKASQLSWSCGLAWLSLATEDNLKNEANLKMNTILFFTENKIVPNGLNHRDNIYEKNKIELH